MTNLSEELTTLLDNCTIKYPLPYKKGSSIFIGKIVIRKTKSGYLLYDVQNKEQVCTTFSKYGALAIAKQFTNSKNSHVDKLQELDRAYQKHKDDERVYNYNLSRTGDSFKKDLYTTRLETSEDNRYQIMRQLEEVIFN